MSMRKLVMAVIGLLAAPAHGDERLDHLLSLSLEELMAMEVSISTSTPQPLSRSPAAVNVITAEDIRATGATNLVDVLEGVPGIYVRASQFGDRPLLHLRGANAGQTLLMVNGVPMKDLLWGFGIYWKGLPASMIERVEIIRGPGSALYGADAGAGVINVITKTAGRIEYNEAGLRAGSHDSQAGWLQYGGHWGGFDVGLTAEVSGTDGHDPYIRADRLGGAGWAGYGWRNTDLRLGVARGNWRLHADYMRHADLETGLTGAGVLDPLTRGRDSRYSLDLLYDNDCYADDWSLSAALHYANLDYSSGAGFQESPPSLADPDGVINRQRAAERRLNVEASGLYTGLAGHAVRVGAGLVWQDLYSVRQVYDSVDLTDTPAAFAPEKMRRIDYLFAQDVWTLAEDWELTAGARYDHYSDFGGTLNPRLALVWQGSDRLTTKLMYGQAFRAPSYQELYSRTSFTLPNADLKPERSRTWDLAFNYAATPDLRLGLDIFHFVQRDLIAATGTPSQFHNGGRHAIRGIELEAHWQATATLRLAGNYTLRWQDDGPYRIYAVPEREAYLRADWAFRPGWNWNLQANWIGARPRPAGDARDPADAYTVVDTTLRHGAGKHWEFAAALRNLLDADARAYTGAAIADDLPLPGRSLYAEVRYKF